MKHPALLQSFRARFGRSRWLGIAAFILLLGGWRLLEGEFFHNMNPIHLAYIGLGLAYLYAIAPMPWQWTKDRRFMTSFLRGLVQSFLWNSFWLFLVIFLPLSLGSGEALLGQEEVAELTFHDHATSLQIAWVVYTHGVWVACLIGWLLAREEAIRLEAIADEEVHRTLEHAARQAQAQALQAQLDPHVLYNALSGVSELIREDTAKAEAAVIHLSGLYRRLTALGRQETVTLEEERHVLEDYLAVEQLRLGTRLRVKWEWPESLNSRRVPPLLVQPLVENAIKHGLAPEETGGNLLISAVEFDEELLRILVKNDGKLLDPGHKQGTGLANLTARLALIGGGSRFELRQEGTLTVADLLILSRRTP